MTITNRIAAACAVGLLTVSLECHANAAGEKIVTVSPAPGAVVPKSATVQTLGSRATSSAAATIYGGFSFSNDTTVYILVRGPSLRTLGITQNVLDAPWVRLYNSAGVDLVTTGSTKGFTACLSSVATDAPVVTYYQVTRREPVDARDSCVAATLSAGTYTFSVTPSTPGLTSPVGGASSFPSSGEILFEVTLGPTPPVETNQSRTERLVGGTWTFTYSIISTFSNRYSFTSVGPSTSVPGDYVAFGTDEFGGSVVGTYSSGTAQWGVLDPSIIIDLFYVFTFLDNNRVSGCYYQISPPGTTNLSQCYSMNGSRFPLKSLTSIPDPTQRQREFTEGIDQPRETDPEVIKAYLRARKQLSER